MNENIKRLAEQHFFLPTKRTEFNDAVNEFTVALLNEIDTLLTKDRPVSASVKDGIYLSKFIIKNHFGVE